MSTLPDEGPGLPDSVEDGRELRGLEFVHLRGGRHVRAAANGRWFPRSRRRHPGRRCTSCSAFPRIVAADAAQVGEDAVDDAAVLATTILDSLLHNSHVLNITDHSYRLRDLEKAVTQQARPRCAKLRVA